MSIRNHEHATFAIPFLLYRPWEPAPFRCALICGACFLLLVFTSSCMQIVLTFDTSRNMGPAFPKILYAIKMVHDEYGEAFTEKTLYAVFAANFIVPVYYVGQKTLYPSFSYRSLSCSSTSRDTTPGISGGFEGEDIRAIGPTSSPDSSEQVDRSRSSMGRGGRRNRSTSCTG